MKINFKNLSLKNFLSYGNNTQEISFNPGLTLVSAKNGNGKSSLIDALTFALFGKPFRKVKLSSLVNNKSNKNLLVHLELDIDNIPYKIIRGIKPNIFEIYREDELISQNSATKDYQIHFQENILRFNENVFRQLIVLGANISSSKNFMDLSQKEKEDVFQIVTDTSIFLELDQIIKQRVNTVKTLKTENEYKNDVLLSTIESESHNIKQLEEQNQYFKNSKQNDIDNLKNNIDESNEKLKQYEVAIEKLKKLKEKFDENNIIIKELQDKTNSKSTEVQNIKDQLKQIEHIKDTSVECENCNHINKSKDIDISDKRIEELQEQLVALENEYNDLNTELNDIISTNNSIKEKLLNSKRIKQNKEDLVESISTNNSKIKVLEDKEILEIDYSALKEKKQHLEDTQSKLRDISTDFQRLQTIKELLSSNHIKGLVLSKQIPLLNKYINEFLEKFDTINFHFVLHKDFKEQIVERNEVKEYNSLSNGQKMRLTFSILFAFLKLIQERNGIEVNILILDEVLDSSADAQGRNELLNILHEQFSDKNVVVISHNDNIKSSEKFNNFIDIIKENNFSKIIKG